MNILVTGSNGFIGKHLVVELLRRGHRVSGIGKNPQSAVKGLTHYYSGNILDKELVAQAIQDNEVVVHLAALTAHAEIIDNKYETLEINFLGTKNILDAFTHSKTTKKFLYASTGKVYGKIAELPLTEKSVAQPLNILGKSKLITEQLIDFYQSTKQSCVVFRIFNVYGPEQKNNFLVPTILKQITKSKTIELGDIEAKRDYVYIDDVVQAFVLAIETKGILGVTRYNICSGIGTSAKEIVRIIGNLVGKKLRIQTNSMLFRKDEMDEEYGSYTLAKKNLGWEPKVNLVDGLKKMIE